MAAVSNVLQSGNPDIDGVLSGLRWSSGALTYSFPTSASQYGYPVTGFQAFNAAQQAATISALASYAAIANVTFTKVASGSGTLRFGEIDDAGTAYAYYPDASEIGGDAFFNHVDYNTAAKGTYSYLTFLHEIGHTLGLDHGQDGIGALPTSHDSLEYSVMTYRSYVGAPLTGYTVAEGSFPMGLMLADIAAMQYMYGANYGTNAGNSVYKWSPTTGEFSINGTAQARSTTNTIFQTIWDGGGKDTYDFSNYTANLKVNLTPGEWSTTTAGQLANLGFGHFARGNIANAWMYEGKTASLIENATGGTGNDTIIGNQAANVLKGGSGNDSLKGLTGNDTIDGGAGTDTCYIGIASTSCTVTYDASAKTYLIISSSDGRDTVTGVEYFAFTDKTILAGVLEPDAPILVSSSPADNATAVLDNANIVLTFSETVVAGSGKIVIHKSDGTIFESFSVASHPAGLTISGKTVTINPTSNFAGNTGYYVTIEAGALKDIEGKAFSGIVSTTDLNFITEKGVTQGTAQSETISGTNIADKIYGNGGNDALIGRAGNDTIDGGAGNDNMSGGRGNDIFVVNSSGDKVVEAVAQGTDTVRSSISFVLPADVENLQLTGTANISGTGNGLANTITGNAGNNVLKGVGGNDTLVGGNGADRLDGGIGSDVLTGGAGGDNFAFSAALGSSNIDTITDFSVVSDSILLSQTVFAALDLGSLHSGDFALASSAGAASAHLIYNSATGALFYDKDGGGGSAAIKFAILDTGLALTSADFAIV